MILYRSDDAGQPSKEAHGVLALRRAHLALNRAGKAAYRLADALLCRAHDRVELGYDPIEVGAHGRFACARGIALGEGFVACGAHLIEDGKRVLPRRIARPNRYAAGSHSEISRMRA